MGDTGGTQAPWQWPQCVQQCTEQGTPGAAPMHIPSHRSPAHSWHICAVLLLGPDKTQVACLHMRAMSLMWTEWDWRAKSHYNFSHLAVFSFEFTDNKYQILRWVCSLWQWHCNCLQPVLQRFLKMLKDRNSNVSSSMGNFRPYYLQFFFYESLPFFSCTSIHYNNHTYALAL